MKREKEGKQITIVCCWTNETQLNEFVDSVKKQTVSCELILIDNRDSIFNSCSKAFNSVIDRITTKFVIYSHQDIILFKEDSLEKFIAYLKMINENDILGVAGALPEVTGTITNVRLSENGSYAGSKRANGLNRCQTLDECFFGGYTAKFKDDYFDEKICDNWHLYAVEMCLRTLSKGSTVYVCDIELVHLSKGRVNSIYNKTFFKLCKKYSAFLSNIATPCGYVTRTRFPYREIKLVKSNLRLYLK